jgi:hypothetical protein
VPFDLNAQDSVAHLVNRDLLIASIPEQAGSSVIPMARFSV